MDERGGSAVIVLHGWGAPGDDLVPVAEALNRPGARFFVPAAPLPEVAAGAPGGTWIRTPDRRTRTAIRWRPAFSRRLRCSPRAPPCRSDHDGRRSLRAVDGGAGRLLAGGDALDRRRARRAPRVDLVVAMSAIMLVDSVPGLTAPHPTKPRFLSHGRHDPVLPFEGGSKARTCSSNTASPSRGDRSTAATRSRRRCWPRSIGSVRREILTSRCAFLFVLTIST